MNGVWFPEDGDSCYKTGQIIVVIIIIIIIHGQRQFFRHIFQDIGRKLDKKSFNSLEDTLFFSSLKYRDRFLSPPSHQLGKNCTSWRK